MNIIKNHLVYAEMSEIRSKIPPPQSGHVFLGIPHNSCFIIIAGRIFESSSVWVWRGWRFGLVLKSTPTKQPSQLPPKKLNVTTAVVGPEGLSTSGVYGFCLDSSPGHPFLNRGCRYLTGRLSGVRGFDENLRALLGQKSGVLCHFIVCVDRRCSCYMGKTRHF